MRSIITLISVILISGCSAIAGNLTKESKYEEPEVVRNLNTEFHTMPAPATGQAVVGVYGFSDKTGQRKPSSRMAQISTAVTQGAEVWLIKALQEVGDGKWFKVVERVGAGARYLGIGTSKEYRQDVVTVTMRMVSVQSGEVLLSVSVTKTIISAGTSMTFFKFFDMGTKNAELEMGYTINEPVNYAVRVAIEQSVVELIKEGERKGFWKFAQDQKSE